MKDVFPINDSSELKYVFVALIPKPVMIMAVLSSRALDKRAKGQTINRASERASNEPPSQPKLIKQTELHSAAA